MQVPGKCKNSDCTSDRKWVDYDSELCRDCEIDEGKWGHRGTPAEDGQAIQRDTGPPIT